MKPPNYLALVVDDEPISRKMLTYALIQEGFSCDTAEDGSVASLLCRHHQYDLVVTDLLMPNKHGHSLVVDLLASEKHPAVIVHTAVDDARITKDLLARGVDDVVYKPTNYKTLAARAAVLVKRRRESPKDSAAPREPVDTTIETVNIEDVERRLEHLSKILPVSQTAFAVYDLTSSDDVPMSQIAAAIARDPSLSADVLRLANSAFCHNNPSGKKIVELEEAVLRIGQKRIGELALATSALSAVTANVLPWIDVDLAWRRSVAAGVAVDLLLAQGNYPNVGGGLFLSAIMHLLGRLGLGMSYPRQYQRMVEHCMHSGESLDAIEESVFPLNSGQVMGYLLKAWNLPEEICLPLSYTAYSFLSLAPLDEPLRTQAELLKLAIFIGQIAVGKWDSWDKLEFPSNSVIKRLRIDSLSRIVQDTRADTQQIIGNQQLTSAEGKNPQPPQSGQETTRPVGQIDYCNLTSGTFDYLREVATSAGFELNDYTPDENEVKRSLLINCLWCPPKKFADSFPADKSTGEKLFVTDANHAAFYRHLGNVVALPTSYGAFQLACKGIIQHK